MIYKAAGLRAVLRLAEGLYFFQFGLILGQRTKSLGIRNIFLHQEQYNLLLNLSHDSRIDLKFVLSFC